MPSSVSFIGSGFYVASASQVQGAVRVKFSSAPKAVSALGVSDALNPVNYVLSGPGPYAIAGVNSVSGDPLSFDIVLGAALALGTWTVQVSNVQTTASNPLTAPTAAQFQVTSSASAATLTGGAEDDNPETIIRKHLSPALRGPNWDALIKALSVGDDVNWTNARSAFDQLFLSTASGSYLERKAGDQGLIKPLNVGIDDELFRKLAIKTSANKVVHEAIREILEVYFGQDSLRAFTECEVDEKYNLTGSVDLTWTLDEKETFSHTFVSSEFGSPSYSTAIEVAFALTKVMMDAGSRGFASVYQSPVTGKNRVRIYSGSLGLGSFVRVTGGTAQNVLQFPTQLNTYSGTISGTSYTWVYTHPDQNTSRASLTTTSPTLFLVDISTVQEGDYVIIGSSANAGVTGTFAIKAVSVKWNSSTQIEQAFDIERIAFTGSAIQMDNNGYTFYRPTKNSIAASAGRTVVVAQTQNGLVDISIPATTQIVSRGPSQATYGRLNSTLDIVRVFRDPTGLTTITTALPHGLTAGNQVQIDNFVPAPGIPFITPGNGAVYPSTFTYAASLLGIVAESQIPPTPVGEDARATTLSNGHTLFCGGFTRAAGTIVNTNGFQSSGVSTISQNANRYVPEATAIITDATEADGATRSSHSWASTADMNFPREHHAVSSYLTGAIATGGMTEYPYSILNTAEQYQLNSIWLSLPTMLSPRCGHQQVTLDNGNIMVVGGASAEGTALNTTEIYDGVSWSAGPSMNIPRTDFQLIKLTNGNYMAIGGRTLGRGHTKDQETLALWSLDESGEGPGVVIADSTGTYPLTTVGSPPAFPIPGAPISNANGKVNNCWDFSTSGTRLIGTGSATAQRLLLGPWTVEFWFKHQTADDREFVTYGGPTATAADNLLLNVGMSASGYLFWRWENGSGSPVTQGSTYTWPSTSIASSRQTDLITSNPIWRNGFFNHIALRKSFNSPKNVIAGSRVGSTVTLFFDAPHGLSSGDIYFVSQDSLFASNTRTITSVTSTTISFTEAGTSVPYRVMRGTVGVTFDVTLFVNGTQIQTWTNLANASGGPTSGTAWYVAHNPEIASSGCEDYLDDIRVSTVARSEAEIRGNFLKGWGHQRSLADTDLAIGAMTDTCEVLNTGTNTWALVGNMTQGRAYHQAVVIPGGAADGLAEDFVLVHGGLGYDPTQVPPVANPATVGLWPNNSLRDAEVYDPNVKRWFPVRASGVRRHGHAMYYLSSIGKVVVVGGSSFNQDPLDVDDTGYPELFDITTRTWRTAPVKYRTAAGATCSLLTNSQREVVLYGGFDQTGATNTRALTYITGCPTISGPGFNSQHMVIATPSLTTLQIQTSKTQAEVGCTSSFGSSFLGDDGSWNQTRVGGTWKISTGSKSGGTTTLVLSFPTGYSTHGINIGDIVYVNSRTGAFGGGLKTVTATTGTSISYAEAGTQSSISAVGSVSVDWSPDVGLAPLAAVASPINDPGPFLFDPTDGLAITATESTIVSAPLYANQHYEEVEINDVGGQGSAFPDEVGYIVVGFGTSTQTSPIKYLGRYKSSPTTARLVLDYAYRFNADQPIGSKVTFLSQRQVYAPIGAAGSAYVTSSSAGRVAASAAAEEALAAGVTPRVSIVYPGDRGLGGEGYPSHGAQKLSDKVGIFAGDDITLEVQEDREK